jgi:hypothetical protein
LYLFVLTYTVSSGTICSELLLFSEDDFVDLFVPPDKVQKNSITKHLLTSLYNYILFCFITVLLFNNFKYSLIIRLKHWYPVDVIYIYGSHSIRVTRKVLFNML